MSQCWKWKQNYKMTRLRTEFPGFLLTFMTMWLLTHYLLIKDFSFCFTTFTSEIFHPSKCLALLLVTSSSRWIAHLTTDLSVPWLPHLWPPTSATYSHGQALGLIITNKLHYIKNFILAFHSKHHIFFFISLTIVPSL